MKKLLAIALMLLPLAAQARVEPREGEEPITPEPKITIVQDKEKDSTLQIYEVNGQIYGIRVIPRHGVPYNLVDPNGAGNFIPNAADRILMPQWVLKRF